MSNLPGQLAVNHNDDHDESLPSSTTSTPQNTNNTNTKFSTITSRITSPLIIKRQQIMETKIANNQAYDEIHDVQSKHSYINKTTNDDRHSTDPRRSSSPSNLDNSHELMQSNYYDQTRFDLNYASSSKLSSERGLIDINIEEYKKTIAPISTSRKTNSQHQANSPPPFGNTCESIQQGIAESAGILLELNKKPPEQQPQYHCEALMKKTSKPHERPAIDCIHKDEHDVDEDNDDDDDINKQRSLSSSDCSASDSSTSTNDEQHKNEKLDSETTIPYEELLNDNDDDDDNDENLVEQTKKTVSEATTLLNKNLSQTYGTQSTTTTATSPCERSKSIATNGYNSHGSSITTKSSSDNSGSIRTNSGSDNDEESDEEHYNNSTLANNSHSTSIFSRENDSSTKMFNKSNEHETNQYTGHVTYSNDTNSYQSTRSNSIRSEQLAHHDERHLQVPRLKQLAMDETNDNTNTKLSSDTDCATLPYTSKWPLQSSGNNLSSSSHQNRNLPEPHDQAQSHHSNSTRTNTRQQSMRAIKKRKQLQQQELIRTELIPGHRGDRDVDELVMFIDGNPSKQRHNSAETRINSKINSLPDSNSNKTTCRKKSRKTAKTLQSTDNQQGTIESNEATSAELKNLSSNSSIDNHDQTNQSLEYQDQSIDRQDDDPIQKSLPTDNNHLSQSNTIFTNDANTIKCNSSSSDWFEETRHTSIHSDDDHSLSLPANVVNNLNNAVISDPFVTVKHRRRSIKERRPDHHHSLAQPPRFSVSSSSTMNEKRRYPSTSQHEMMRPSPRNSLSNIKPIISSAMKQENNIPTPSESVPSAAAASSSISGNIQKSSVEKAPTSPRLSSNSSAASLPSLVKRQTKPPPVVFLNKSINVELHDVSFGFDIDSIIANQSSDDMNPNPLPPTIDREIDTTNTSTPPPSESRLTNDVSTDFTSQYPTGRSFQQRNTRDPQFYSGSDIRPHHRSYPSQPMPSASYMDPLLLQYNQQRFASYSQQVAYMNYLRTPYLSSPHQYVLVPTTCPTTSQSETDPDEKPLNDHTSEHVQEPLLVYATIPNQSSQMYFHPSANKTSFIDGTQPSPSLPNMYTTTPTMYPPQHFYPRPAPPHLFPSSATYFQPISSPSLFIDTKTDEQKQTDHDNHHRENSVKSYHSTDKLPLTSAGIMSSALKLVYSQQQRNAQTDRFNLDDLTAYLAMKWTETVDNYEQGDSQVLLIDQQK